MPSGFVAAERLSGCRKADQLQNVPVEHFNHENGVFLEYGWNVICYEWRWMMDYDMYEVDDEMEWIQFMKWSGRI